jgi:transposase
MRSSSSTSDPCEATSTLSTPLKTAPRSSMAPNLATSQRNMIRDMIVTKKLTAAQIADAVRCSVGAVKYIRSNLRCFGAVKAPCNGGGRPRSITPPMLEALREHLLEKPDRYLDELVVFMWDDFEAVVTASTINRALKSAGWSKKTCRRVASGRNADLRDFYLHNLPPFSSYHLVYVDESGCDKRIGFRRTGWSPLGITPVQIARYRRERRWQILPAYTQNGILLSRVFQGSTDGAAFEDCIEQLLHHCGRWPEPRSVLAMDNASFHHTERMAEMCADAGVKLIYLPTYSPDLNPIEEFFAELKAFIKRSWSTYEKDTAQRFDVFLEWCVDQIGSRKESARGHFRHSGWTIDEL